MPGFKTPGYPIIPAIGLIAGFVLIYFMQTRSLIYGGVVLVASAIFYFAYARGKTLENPSPPHIEPKLRRPKILLPVSLPMEKNIPFSILRAFTDLEVLLLGYKELKEQIDPEQYEEEDDGKSEEELNTVKQQLDNEDFDVETQLVFTPDVAQTIDNAIIDYNCSALLIVKPISELRRLLIPVYDLNQLSKRFATVIYELTQASDLPAELLFIESPEEEADEEENEGRKDLSAMKEKAFGRLKQSGVDLNQIKSSSIQVENISEAVEKNSKEEDLLILVEANAKEREDLINRIREEITEKIDCPLLVVFRRTGCRRKCIS